MCIAGMKNNHNFYIVLCLWTNFHVINGERWSADRNVGSVRLSLPVFAKFDGTKPISLEKRGYSLKTAGELLVHRCLYNKQDLSTYPYVVLYKNYKVSRWLGENFKDRGYLVFYADMLAVGDSTEVHGRSMIPPRAESLHGCMPPHCSVSHEPEAGRLIFKWLTRYSDFAEFLCLQGVFRDDRFYARSLLSSHIYEIYSPPDWDFGQLVANTRFPMSCDKNVKYPMSNAHALYLSMREKSLSGSYTIHGVDWYAINTRAGTHDYVSPERKYEVRQDRNSGDVRILHILDLDSPQLQDMDFVNARLNYVTSDEHKSVRCAVYLKRPAISPEPTEPIIDLRMRTAGISVHNRFKIPRHRSLSRDISEDGIYPAIDLRCRVQMAHIDRYPVVAIYKINKLTPVTFNVYFPDHLEKMEQNRSYIVFYKVVVNASEKYGKYFPLGSPRSLRCGADCTLQLFRHSDDYVELQYKWSPKAIDLGQFWCVQGLVENERFDIYHVLDWFDVRLQDNPSVQVLQKIKLQGANKTFQYRPVTCGGTIDREAMILVINISNFATKLPSVGWSGQKERGEALSTWTNLRELVGYGEPKYDEESGTFQRKIWISLVHRSLWDYTRLRAEYGKTYCELTRPWFH